jgi:hypothetical protein
MNSTALTRKLDLATLIAIYEQAERDIRAGMRLIGEAETRLNDSFVMDGSGRVWVRQRHHEGLIWGEADEAMKEVARCVWGIIVDRLELRRILSVSRWKELDRQLREGELPPITAENVAKFAAGYAENIEEMHAEAVREVFDWLRPRDNQGWGRDRYATNRKSFYTIGRKVILEYMVGRDFGKWRVEYGKTQNLTALENVFQALDGQGMVNRTHRSALQDAIEASEDGRGETPYFAFKCFRNKNLHVEFLRDDLRAEFNRIAGGKNLRPEAA